MILGLGGPQRPLLPPGSWPTPTMDRTHQLPRVWAAPGTLDRGVPVNGLGECSLGLRSVSWILGPPVRTAGCAGETPAQTSRRAEHSARLSRGGAGSPFKLSPHPLENEAPWLSPVLTLIPPNMGKSNGRETGGTRPSHADRLTGREKHHSVPQNDDVCRYRLHI